SSPRSERPGGICLRELQEPAMQNAKGQARERALSWAFYSRSFATMTARRLLNMGLSPRAFRLRSLPCLVPLAPPLTRHSRASKRLSNNASSHFGYPGILASTWLVARFEF